MSRRSSSLMLFTAIAGMAAAPALSQIRPMGVAPPRASAPAKPKTTAPDAPVPGNPDFAADQAAQPEPVAPPLPPPMWDVPNVLQLLAYIQQLGAEGLNPADYDPAGLQAALQSGDPVATSAAATERFNLVSADLALGHVKKPARIDTFSCQRSCCDSPDIARYTMPAYHSRPSAPGAAPSTTARSRAPALTSPA